MSKKTQSQSISGRTKRKNQKKFPSMRGNSLLIVLFIILIFIIAGLFLFWRMFFGFGQKTQTIDFEKLSSLESPVKNTVKNNLDPALIGTWESDCLVPDFDSPWSEKHQFIINSDGSAQHTRWSSGGHACSPETTMVDKYSVSTPSTGQIDFNLIEGTGPVSDDIYQVSGNTLLFGHGFRNNFPYAAGSLNQYIVYKKK
jgi:hypothetical protein